MATSLGDYGVVDAGGNVETIRTTDEHPFYVTGHGWVSAADLTAGTRLSEADGTNDAVVLSSVREEHPQGVAVFNFEVTGDHTYFVEDGNDAQTALWVHNTCRDTIIDDLGRSVQPYVQVIRSIAADAQVGFRGSLARGTKGLHKGGGPFDAGDFDVDAFIVSDSLAAQIGERTRFRSGSSIKSVRAIQRTIDAQLRSHPSFAGLRSDPFTFRVFTRAEAERLLAQGDHQIYFRR